MKKDPFLSCTCQSLSRICAGLLALLLVSAGAVLHAAPVNDNFASSIPLRSLVVTTTGDNVGATSEFGEPFHYATTGGSSVWWNWTAPFSGVATITTSNSSFDTILAVYTGPAVGSLTLMGNNDDNGAGGLWSRVAFTAVAGTTYQIAVDGLGGAVGSIVLNVTGPASGAPVSLVSPGAAWKYLDDGSDQGTSWVQAAFNDSSWSNGVAQLGFGEGDEATVIRQTNSLGTANITFYFRRAFSVANPADFTSLNLLLLRDDAGIVYLNGQEVFRSANMPGGAINYLTLATATGENNVDAASLAPSAVVAGNNLVAVEIHQQALTSSDVSFDLSLGGVPVAGGSNGAPIVAIASPAGGATLSAGSDVSVSVVASDPDGSVARVELYLDGAKIAETSAHPYSMIWSSAAAGPHTLAAVVVDNQGLAVTSAPVSVQATTGMLPGGLEFNGADNYVTFGYAPALGVSNFTLEVWFKRTGTGIAGSSGGGGISAIPLLTKGRGENDGDNRDCNFFLGIDAVSGVLAADFESFEYYSTNNHRVYGNTVITNNGWYHAAATFNGTNWALYLNGNLETNAPAPYTPRWDNIQHAALATTLDSGGNPSGYFAGVLDEARIWNYARSAAQIAAGRTQEITSGAGLLARWGMNQSSGSVLNNSVAGNPDGTLINNPLWVAGYLFAQPPVVSIISPADLAAFTQPAGITIDASATDPNGAVAKVEFFRDGVKLGEDTVAPFSYTWSGAGVGNFVLTAVASDDTALSSTSAPVRITVNSPFVALTNPTNTARFGAPASIALASSATNTATQVQFYNGATLLNTDTAAPYGYAWNSVAAGNYPLTAVATAGGIRHTSAPVTIAVINNQFPTVALTSPANNSTFEEPATIRLAATASDSDGAIAKVEFFNGANKLGEDVVAPFSLNWSGVTASVAQLTAVATDDIGARSTSAVVNVTIVTNTPPFVATVAPTPGTVGGLTSITVNFSEAVGGVNASDLLLNGVPANSVSGGGASYTFSVTEPATNNVAVTWAVGHGIADLGNPPKPFDPAVPGNTWSYVITDLTPPTILAQTPAAGSSVSALTEIAVTFSEPVSGVSAADFLINGSPAFSVSGSGANYTFTFPQPVPGAVSNTWAVGHGIADLAAAPNAFNASGPGATWSYTVLTPRTMLVASNSVWKFLDDGTDQGTAWSQTAFDDSVWASGPAELGYGDGDEATVVNGGPSGSRFITTYFRHAFAATNAASFTNLIVHLRRDDGAVVYLNGVEIFRDNIAGDPILFNTLAVNATDDGSIWFEGNASIASLVEGTNLVAVEIHQNAATSSDISFDLELVGEGGGAAYSPPYLTVVSPTPGDVLALTNITIIFSEPVTGVNAGDLLINGVPAAGVSGATSNTTFTFSFAQPAFGSVAVAWAAAHGIADFDTPPHPFNAVAPGTTFQYRLFNPNAPTVLSQNPVGGTTVFNTLTQIAVTFSKAVTGVNASDLFVNATPAVGVSGSGASYTFTFAQPAYGNVGITWASNPGITEAGLPANAFEPSRPGATWQYTFLDIVAPTIVSKSPTAGASVTNLTQITVQFSESVKNVDAADLLINGDPATGVTGTNATYTFTFPQPNATVLNISWAANHGITDFAAAPNAFDASAPGASWIYSTPDNVPPIVVNLTPTAGATIRALTQITVLFNENVTGLNASDLLIKGTPAISLSGAGAGPYTFSFTQPTTGAVSVAWAAAHGIKDLATPANNFAGGSWTYTLNPNARFDGAVVINEIMYHPISENPLEEYIELRNVTSAPINVAGWRFTRGVDFTFPVGTIPAFGFLVVAADAATFQAKYPGVTNVLGNWVGRLSNIDEDVELEDATGTRVDLVHYADQGDWAIRQRGPLDLGSRGWEWYAEHDGTAINSASLETSGGKSLELIQPLQPNDNGQNWNASAPVGGTPGRTNSIVATNIAPLIYNVAHFPAVPKPANVVFLTAQLLDEKTNGVTAQLFFRNATTTTPGSFISTNLLDDGLHGDGAANDRIFGAILPASANGTVIEFYVQAADSFGASRTWPAAARQLDGSFAQTANALYQVDDNLAPPSPATANHPLYRVIMTGAERQELQNINRNSDAEMNATFITVDGTDTEVRHNCGIRIRGAGSRGRAVANHRVNIPNDRRWKGVDEANFNTQFIHIQSLGSALAAKAGLPAAEARPVQLRINGANLASSLTAEANWSQNGQGDGFGSYVYVESLNGDWANRVMPTNSGGNAYRGSVYPWIANLKFLDDTNSATWVANGYSKTSNGSENDWRDLNELTRALSDNLPENAYLEAVRTNVNVELFLRYFALSSLLDYRETSLCRGVGDDYAMYRGTTDPRFQLVPHDFDTILGLGDTGGSATRTIWEPVDNPATTASDQQALFLIRFLRHPEYAPVYFRELKRLVETTFSATQFNPLADEVLGGWVPQTTIDGMKSFVNGRRVSILSQLPLTYSVNVPLPTTSGYYFTSVPDVTLDGQANAIDARTVKVNGSAANYVVWQGRWNNSITLAPGINNVLVQYLGAGGAEVGRTNVLIWYDDGSAQNVSGAIAANTSWTAAGGPYNVTGNLTVNAGATLTIQAGTTIYLANGVNITVANGGRIVADGNETAPIRFTRMPGASTSWGGITINGGAGTPTNYFAHTHFEFNGSTAIHSASGTVFLDHLTFGNTGVQYLSLDASSFVVQNCHFPNATGSFELVHGNQGLKAGGQGVFRRNFFGTATGYNDVVDFTGGNRPGPILQFINNVFVGSGDDLLDLDGTDTWVEGNIFMHAHKNGSPDTASAVSGGDDGGQTSQITVIGNLIYDCDHAAMAKGGNFTTFINNTVVRQTRVGGTDTDAAVACLADEGFAQGAGMFIEGNILYDIEKLVRFYTNSVVTFTNNLMPLTWAGPGGNNSTNNPLLAYVPQLSETMNFTTWASAQVMREWFSLKTGSPASGTGPLNRDKGGVVPLGAAITGEPASPTSLNAATLTVGVNRTGNGIPAAGWPNGSGFTHYKWRLDGGAWSAETPIATPITLSGLTPGAHYVEVSGKNDAGLYQDDPVLGPDATVTRSRTWTVTPGASLVRLNELLASNDGAYNHFGTSPDIIELFNAGNSAMDLAGLRLTDNPQNPSKFIFLAGATIPAGGYLAVFANNPDGKPGYHVGFNLPIEGGQVFLFDSTARGGVLLDSIQFGPQLADRSIGRLADGQWTLCVPTIGAANQAAQLGNARALRINEWLTDGLPLALDDFVELYNPQALPMAMGGLYLTDNPVGWPDRHPIAALSFLSGYSFFAFKADGNVASGPEHLNFSLSSEQGMIGLFDADLTLIDSIYYNTQQPGIAMGRQPNGSTNSVFLAPPTPGSGNPAGTGGGSTNITTFTVNLLSLTDSTWRYDQEHDLTVSNWTALAYNDAAWSNGPSLLAFEDNAAILPLVRTALADPRVAAPGLTAPRVNYFRTTFNFPTNPAGFDLNLTLRVDDGAVLYLNGAELTRVRVNAGAVDYSTLANAIPPSGSGDATTDELLTLPASLMVQGVNVLAVEVHQMTPTSSDIVWGLGLTATKSSTNVTGGIGLVINEVLANNSFIRETDGSTPDWIELFNNSGGTIDLSDLSLTGDTLQPRRWVFPAGASIAPLSHLRILCEDKLPPSSNTVGVLNTAFGLKATGGGVYLYDRQSAGGSLLTSVTFGLQATDFSIGRLPDGTGSWTLTQPSPASQNIAVGLGNPATLRLNEWMADPSSGDDWFEVFNPNAQPVALGGLYLTDRLNTPLKYPIPALSFLGVNTNGYQTFLADENTGAGADHVNFRLSAGGESLGLFTAAGVALDSLNFGPQMTGLSEGRFPDGSANIVSFPGTDSVGESNYRWLTNVVINEVLAHSDPPWEDAIELHNLTAAPINIGGWWLSDAKGNLRKFRVPDGKEIPANGFVVVYEYEFNPDPLLPNSFALSSSDGDQVYLAEASGGSLTGWRTSVKFGASANAVSFGRHVTSVGGEEFVAMSQRSFGKDTPADVADFRTGTGLNNPYPLVGPVVLAEIMYHPPDLGTNDNTRDEFIKLRNITASPVPLYDSLAATNTWRLRDAVDFDFPLGVVLPAGGALLVVSFDPVADPFTLGQFRSAYGLGTNVPIYGPYSGKLANSSDSIELKKPDPVNTNGSVPYVLVEQITFSDAEPWPTSADGLGPSLHRVSATGFGSDPTNWLAAAASPGGTSTADTDDDGMPDAWELANGFDLSDPSDAEEDFDGDRLSNQQEYQAGTDPRSAASVLGLEITGIGPVVLEFAAKDSKSYTVQYSTTLEPNSWLKLIDIPAGAERRIQVNDPSGQTRFYRLRTPQTP